MRDGNGSAFFSSLLHLTIVYRFLPNLSLPAVCHAPAKPQKYEGFESIICRIPSTRQQQQQVEVQSATVSYHRSTASKVLTQTLLRMKTQSTMTD